MGQVCISEREEAWRPEEQGKRRLVQAATVGEPTRWGWGAAVRLSSRRSPQGRNLFPQAGRLNSSRSVYSEYAERVGVHLREGGSVEA